MKIPSKASFSKFKSELWFDNRQINSILIMIPQGHLAADDFEISPVLNMRGIPAGSHTIKVAMYEIWPSGQKFSQVAKEVKVDYIPQKRESTFIKVPIVKSIVGTDLAFISESDKDIYREIEKTIKEEHINKRDDW